MKASERRLLGAHRHTHFVALGGLLRVVPALLEIRDWQHTSERREREVELARMESRTMIAQAPQGWPRKDDSRRSNQRLRAEKCRSTRGCWNNYAGSATGAGLEISDG